MLDWLKKFEESSLGMLFTDQHLSPSEIVRIAQRERSAEQSAVCTENTCRLQENGLPHTQLVGLR